MKKFIELMATWFGTGNSPIMPGTVGTIGAIPAVIILKLINNPIIEGAIILVFILFSILISAQAEKIYGEKDSQNIVIDEVAGYMVTMYFVRMADYNLSKIALSVALGFALFRFFDITKLPPINRLQNIKGGLGVVVDDLMAGVYACIVLQIILFFALRYL